MSHPLNSAQREAVRTAAGPLLVLAGAGTGKTRVVTHRIAELIRRGTLPERILGVTFTNKAAGEMQQRIRKLLGKRQGRPEISTFHSLCVRILRRNIEHLQYPSRFTIHDRADQLSTARQVLREIRVTANVLRPDHLLALISAWKSASIQPVQAARLAEDDRQHVAAVGYRRYQESLKLQGAVDFDDLLLLTDELFRKHAVPRREEALIATCAWSETTISRSTAGVEQRSNTSCDSRRTGQTQRSSDFKRIIVLPWRSLQWPIDSSNSTRVVLKSSYIRHARVENDLKSFNSETRMKKP